MHTVAPSSVTLQPRRLRFLVTVDGDTVTGASFRALHRSDGGRVENVMGAELQDPEKSKQCDRWLQNQPGRRLIIWNSTQNFKNVKGLLSVALERR